MTKIQDAVLLSKIRRIEPGTVQGPKPSNQEVQGSSFDSILDSESLQFSKHAEKRLLSREIELSGIQRSQLDDAVKSLEKKGAKDSLVLMGELAFIVNVPSKTVVTAMAKDQMKEQVFTNIDSTILV